MLKLIVHADDFGLSERVNAGIERAHVGGVLTSTSLIANGLAVDDAVRICVATPTLDVGVHLTLVEERPLLAPEQLPSLVTRDGHFHRHATVFARRYLAGAISMREVGLELEAQIQRVFSLGIRVSHLDSHQHVHMLPGVLATTVALAHKYGIRHVRMPREAVRAYMLTDVGAASRLAQLLALRAFCFMGRRAPMAHVQHFAGFFYGGRLNREHLLTVLEHLPRSGTCELMCHPGLDDPGTRYSHWKYSWPLELEALTDPGVADVVKRRGISLISFRDVAVS
jgi:hopanoid biosynthesis associated protein HpnK